jgi:hypothetical protein
MLSQNIVPAGQPTAGADSEQDDSDLRRVRRGQWRLRSWPCQPYHGRRWRPQGRSHEPTAVLPDLGLGWPESAHQMDRDTTPGRAARLLQKSKERVAGRALLDRAEGGGSRRTGLGRAKIQECAVGSG